MADPPLAAAAAAMAPPPPPGRAPVDAPQRPAAGAAGGTTPFTPPPQNISAPTAGSAVSSLTNPSAPGPAATPSSSRKRPADMCAFEDSPSPKKPDFSRPTSDDNSLMSGADEEQWGREEARVMAEVERANMEELGMEEGEADNIETTQEWMELAEEGLDDDEGAGDDEGAEEVQYETVQVQDTREFPAPFLHAICKEVNLTKTGKKAEVFKRIRDCGHARIKKVSDEMFEYQKVKAPEGTVPKWVVMTGTPASEVEGIDMGTGAQRGYFGPTNKENAVGPTKMEYFKGVGEKIQRPAFAWRKPPPADENGNVPPAPPRQGGPSDFAKGEIDDLRTARPSDFFKLMWTEDYMRSVVDMTNNRAASEGAAVGGMKYTDFKPFNVAEMWKFVGLLVLNGLSPKPSMDLWFLRSTESKLFGNDHVAPAMDKHLGPGMGKINGYRRWQHLRAFLCLYDYRKMTRERVDKDPLFKVRSLLNELNHRAKKCWRTGAWVSIDEQTLGFKGKHGMKLRISYKREGDGFQCDAVCDEGYTFSFFFRHGEAPVLPAAFKHLDLSPTARRVVWLAMRLPHLWSSVFMDNLFNSRKLFTGLYLTNALGHGVVRAHNRGFCKDIVQTEEKNKAKAEELRGTTKAARLVNCPECPDLLSVSVYDTKPVHLLSTVAEDVHWAERKRRVWSDVHKQIKEIGFLRLNLIDDYNHGMNFVDIADQLRNQYRPDHWMRNRKWWWAFFIWGIGVAATNAWKIYDKMYDEAQGNREVLPPKWDHRGFLVELVHDFIFPEQTKSLVDLLSDMDDETFVGSVKSTKDNSAFGPLVSVDMEDYDFSCDSGIAAFLKAVKPERMTPKRMDTGYFVNRFDGRRHGSVPCSKTTYCQYCQYQYNSMDDEHKAVNQTNMEKNRVAVRRCLVCNVNLCPVCENEFHGIKMTDTAALMGRKS